MKTVVQAIKVWDHQVKNVLLVTNRGVRLKEATIFHYFFQANVFILYPEIHEHMKVDYELS